MVYLGYTVFILQSISKAVWFYLPVLVANLAVYSLSTILKEGLPLDIYKKIKNIRIIGNGRYVAGTLFCIITALFVGILQDRAIEALYLGIGGVTGTIINSLIKRRISLKQGNYFFFFDQTDIILGASIFYISKYNLELNIFIFGLIVVFILHHAVNLLRKSWEVLVNAEKIIGSKLNR